ncbi:MAG: TonB-dependent receptor [Flavisolibacter sp.]
MDRTKKIASAYLGYSMVISVTLLLLSMQALGQNDTLSVNVLAEPFPKFVERIETASSFHFYYSDRRLDSFPVTIRADHQPLATILTTVFEGSPFHFAINYPEVFITVKPIIASLPEGYFDRSRTYLSPSDSMHRREEALQPTMKSKSPVENKLFEIGSGTTTKTKLTLAGYIRDERNGEPISGASVSADSSAAGVMSDGFGYFSLTLTPGRHILHVSSFGMKTTSRQLLVHNDGKLNIDLSIYVPSLKEVVVTASRLSNVRSVSMGNERLTIQTIRQIPVVFGEADILRATLSLPGVTSVGEANTGLNVRGGAADQNLILLNDATIYNPSHLFGFFSAFNPDIVKTVDLYKTAIPEKYGGRLSSVLDVTTRQGNTKKISGSAGIGPLTSKISIEGPIKSEHTTFVVSARSSYSNWILHNFPDPAFRNSNASFYDANFHLTHSIGSKNSIFVNAYLSQDGFRLNSDTVYHYGNRNLNFRWKHNFNNRFYGIVTAGFDQYHYEMSAEDYSTTSFKLGFQSWQTYARADFSYSWNMKQVFNFGVTTTHYNLQPGSLQPFGVTSLVKGDQLSHERGLESAIYLGDEYSLATRLSLHAGLRYSVFNYLGPHEVYHYKPGVPRDELSMTDTIYHSGGVIKSYLRPELRLGLRYMLTDQTSIKLSFNSMTQYQHTLSNTNAISPTDILKLSDNYILPQTGAQLSAGFYRNFKAGAIETSLEVYYKKMDHYLDFKSGAALLLNHHIETEIIDSKGKAYGVELLMKKTSGKFSGWLGYTFSRTLLASADSLAGEKVNDGKYYPANFDKPHNTNFTGIYKFSHRYILSVGVNYSTGRPITLPLAVFNMAGGQRVLYSERNQYRVPDYFRADISFILQGNHKLTKATHNDWTVGVYNLTGRKNVYSIYFTEENGYVKGYRLSIFGAPIPFVTYTIRF